MLSLSDSIISIPGIGKKYAQLLEQLSIFTIEDLLTHYPFRYEDASKIYAVSKLSQDENRTVKVTVDKISGFKTPRKKFLTTAKVSDASGSISVIWFNQKYLTDAVHEGDQVLLYGKFMINRNKRSLYSPEYEVIKSGETTHLGRIRPIYPLTQGISQKWIRSKINYLLQDAPFLLAEFVELIPQSIQKRYDLKSKQFSIEKIHFPETLEETEQVRYSLAFEELFLIQQKMQQQRADRAKERGIKMKIQKTEIKKFFKSLPFEPTSAQENAVKEVVNDLKQSRPMNRLLEGDVGSGKTVVAAAACIPIVNNGYQVALMAPTAILANQHFESLKVMLPRAKIALVTGSSKPKVTADVIVGTHAILFQSKNLLSKLALLIVDEQHRFGVKQREELLKINNKIPDGLPDTIPHLLTMTATPIPRSLALTIFGDLDVSILDELPPGRIPTETYVVPETKRTDSYKWIKDRIEEGNGCFWVCPLIDESEKMQVKSVNEVYKRLQKIYPDLILDVLHGKVSAKEKEVKLQKFAKNKTNILVATSLVEVGIDIPNANVLIIEGAERFGLAQLHQLRGRVGRRKKKSWCLLFPTAKKDYTDPMGIFGEYNKSLDRLQFFAKTNDGLKLAEFDLENRGPGEVYGTTQSGIPNLKIAKITDLELVKKTREAVEKEG